MRRGGSGGAGAEGSGDGQNRGDLGVFCGGGGSWWVGVCEWAEAGVTSKKKGGPKTTPIESVIYLVDQFI